MYYIDDHLTMCCSNVSQDKYYKVMNEVLVGTCGAHKTGPKLQTQLKTIRSYWTKKTADRIGFTQRCQVCVYHGKFIGQPRKLCTQQRIPGYSQPRVWIFGFLQGCHDHGCRYILVITDYFSK